MSDSSRTRSTDRRFYGIAEAIVAEVNDPAKEGRVKLQIPWFDPNLVSDWCRVCQFYAGNKYGSFFVPEVGDEVAIAFVHGDMRLPIVLGGLYNGQDLPATRRDDSTDEKLIRTKAGHQIVLVDTGGQETIRIIEKGGKHSLEISTKDNGITVKSDGGKLVLRANEVEIEADSTLKIKAGGDVRISGATIHLN